MLFVGGFMVIARLAGVGQVTLLDQVTEILNRFAQPGREGENECQHTGAEERDSHHDFVKSRTLEFEDRRHPQYTLSIGRGFNWNPLTNSDVGFP